MTATANVILVAEDHPDIRMLIGAVLQSDGYTVVLAEDGLEAVQRAFQTNPALVVTDGRMPTLDGWEASKRIRARFPHTPILMLTVHTEPYEQERGRACGVTAFMGKPFDPDMLLAEVRRLISPG
ncbi:MAG: response regulator [Chloroflexota bacterium]|nr:response regulator [Chloroflexota bacterium]